MSVPTVDFEAVFREREAQLERKSALSLRRMLIHASAALVTLSGVGYVVGGKRGAAAALASSSSLLGIYAHAYNRGLIAGGRIAEDTRAFYSEFSSD